MFGYFPGFYTFPHLCRRNTLRLADAERARGFRTLLELENSQTSLSLPPRTTGPAERRGGKDARAGGKRIRVLYKTILRAERPPSSGLLGLLKKISWLGLLTLDTPLYRRRGGWVPDLHLSVRPAIPPNQVYEILSSLHVASGKC